MATEEELLMLSELVGHFKNHFEEQSNVVGARIWWKFLTTNLMVFASDAFMPVEQFKAELVSLSAKYEGTRDLLLHGRTNHARRARVGGTSTATEEELQMLGELGDHFKNDFEELSNVVGANIWWMFFTSVLLVFATDIHMSVEDFEAHLVSLSSQYEGARNLLAQRGTKH